MAELKTYAFIHFRK